MEAALWWISIHHQIFYNWGQPEPLKNQMLDVELYSEEFASPFTILPKAKIIPPAMGRKDSLIQLQRAQRREAPAQGNELRSSNDGVAGGLAGIHEGHFGWFLSSIRVCCPYTSGWVHSICWVIPLRLSQREGFGYSFLCTKHGPLLSLFGRVRPFLHFLSSLQVFAVTPLPSFPLLQSFFCPSRMGWSMQGVETFMDFSILFSLCSTCHFTQR